MHKLWRKLERREWSIDAALLLRAVSYRRSRSIASDYWPIRRKHSRYRSAALILTFSRDPVIFYAKREPWGASRAFDVDGAYGSSTYFSPFFPFLPSPFTTTPLLPPCSPTVLRYSGYEVRYTVPAGGISNPPNGLHSFRHIDLNY